MKKFLINSCGRLPAILIIAVFAVALVYGPAVAGKIPDHPDKLKYKDLDFKPPHAKDYRYQLKCGATVYIAENHEVPTFDLTVLVRTGSIYEPLEKAGLADMTAYLMRNGGIEGMTIKEFDEEIAFLAGDISVDIGTTQGSASLFCLSKDIDRALELFQGVIKTPAFEEEPTERHREDLISNMKQRNSRTNGIERREWMYLMYGDHPCTKAYRTTESSINSINREDMIAFHKQYFFPKNFIFALSGDFDTEEIIGKLDALLAGWPDQDLQLPEILEDIPDPTPGVYMIKKEDVNQSRIRLGHIAVKRNNPDRYAISVMNDILGGGGFTSRIVRRVRSDEGLSYGQGSRFNRPVDYKGTFFAYFQTKHATAAFGTRLILEEINRIRGELVEEEIVANAKASFISNLVNPFSNKNNIVNTFAADEYTNRPADYWQNYTKNYEKVTPEDVLAVAQKYLRPDKLVFLVVGDPDAATAGDDKHPDRYTDFGEIKIIPLRDPLTLE